MKFRMYQVNIVQGQQWFLSNNAYIHNNVSKKCYTILTSKMWAVRSYQSTVRKAKISLYSPGHAHRVPWRLMPLEFLDNRHIKVVRLSDLRTGCLYLQGIFLVLISVVGWVDTCATIRPQRLGQWQIPVIPSGIEPASFRIVVQSLN